MRFIVCVIIIAMMMYLVLTTYQHFQTISSINESTLNNLINLSNLNPGFTSILIFILTITFGWITGIFKGLIQKPKLKIGFIDTPTFGCIIKIPGSHNELPIQKNAFSVYFKISNIGNQACTIDEVYLGYIPDNRFCRWFSKRIWVRECIIKSDFQIQFGNSDDIKVYPFFSQGSILTSRTPNKYLAAGKLINGVCYFEQGETYGSWKPRLNIDTKTSRVMIKIKDNYGNVYKRKLNLKFVEVEEALKVNASFGQSLNQYAFLDDIVNTQNQT
jgi:hypothetical protein